MPGLDNSDAFENRGLDSEMAAKYGATFSQGKFLFDYVSRGVLQFRKIRTLDKQFRIEPSGRKLQLYGLDMIQDLPSRPVEPLVFTEGEFDRHAVLEDCGGFAVSVPNGAPSKPTDGARLVADDKQFAYIWGDDEKLIPEIDQFDKIILATDGDGPGLILRNELALRIGEARCWFVTWPVGCKDANETRMKHGPGSVRRVMDDAKPMRPGHLVKPSDIPPARFETTYSTGWGFLDKHIQIIRPELMVVTGVPGHGKGQWIRALCFHLAEIHGFRTAFFAPEDPAHRIKRDMKRFAERRFGKYPNRDQQKQSAEWMDNHFMVSTFSDDENVTLAAIEHEMASAALHHNCQVFVLDPWNEVDHDMGRLSETQYIEKSIRWYKKRLRRYGLLGIIAAHPTKLGEGAEPNLYTISGSANWKNKCDHGIIIKRGTDASGNPSNVVQIVIEKSKDHETTGVPGSVYAEFIRDECDYHHLIQ